MSRNSNSRIGDRRREAVSRTVIGIPLTFIAFVVAVIATMFAVILWVLDIVTMLVMNKQLINPSSPIIRVWNWFRYTAERTLFGAGDRYYFTP